MSSTSSENHIDLLPGTLMMSDEERYTFLDQYLNSRGLLKSDFIGIDGEDELIYEDEEILWKDVIKTHNIFESCKVNLNNFALLDWIPRAPGQYWTEEGAQARSEAYNFIEEKNGRNIIFDPLGKARMVKGGIGCQRLTMKTIENKQLKFLCATTSGVAHKGFVVAMQPVLYSKVAQLIETKGMAICDVSGKIHFWPSNKNIPFYAPLEVPRMYLSVEKIDILDFQPLKPKKFNVTAAVTFSGTVENERGMFFTYSHFDPIDKESIIKSVRWIQHNYVEDRYGGRVITDFDEKVPHFPNAKFPVKILMDPNLSPGIISSICNEEFGINLQDKSIIIEQLTIEGGIMSNITVTGDGVVIGNNNKVVTTINKGLMTEDLRELGEIFALLRGEILELDTVPEREKEHVITEIEYAEEVSADKDPNAKAIMDSLTRAKNILENAGEKYEEAKGWGKRLKDLGDTLKKVVPKIAPLLVALV